MTGGAPASSWAAGQQNGEVNDKAEAQMMLQAKTSLSAAIAAAESGAGRQGDQRYVRRSGRHARL